MHCDRSGSISALLKLVEDLERHRKIRSYAKVIGVASAFIGVVSLLVLLRYDHTPYGWFGYLGVMLSLVMAYSFLLYHDLNFRYPEVIPEILGDYLENAESQAILTDRLLRPQFIHCLAKGDIELRQHLAKQIVEITSALDEEERPAFDEMIKHLGHSNQETVREYCYERLGSLATKLADEPRQWQRQTDHVSSIGESLRDQMRNIESVLALVPQKLPPPHVMINPGGSHFAEPHS